MSLDILSLATKSQRAFGEFLPKCFGSWLFFSPPGVCLWSPDHTCKHVAGVLATVAASSMLLFVVPHPPGTDQCYPSSQPKLFHAALKLLWFAIGIETVRCENAAQVALHAAIRPLLRLEDGHVLATLSAIVLALCEGRTVLAISGVFGAGKTRSAAVLLAGLLVFDPSLKLMVLTKENVHMCQKAPATPACSFYFAWLPEDVAEAFCSLALLQDQTRPYGSFHEVQLGFNGHYQAWLHMEGLYYLRETRSVDEFKILSQMPAERLCQMCDERFSLMPPQDRGKLFAATLRLTVTSKCGSWYADCRALCPGPSSQEDRTLAARGKKKMYCGNYYLNGTPALRSFIYVDVGEPTPHLFLMAGMMQDHHLLLLRDFESLGTPICEICYHIVKKYWAAWEFPGCSSWWISHVVLPCCDLYKNTWDKGSWRGVLLAFWLRFHLWWKLSIQVGLRDTSSVCPDFVTCVGYIWHKFTLKFTSPDHLKPCENIWCHFALSNGFWNFTRVFFVRATAILASLKKTRTQEQTLVQMQEIVLKQANVFCGSCVSFHFWHFR